MTHRVNSRPAPRSYEPGEDTTTGEFQLAAGAYTLAVRTQHGWRGGSATLLLNSAPVLPAFTKDWTGTVTLGGGAYRWQLAGGVQGFVGTFDA